MKGLIVLFATVQACSALPRRWHVLGQVNFHRMLPAFPTARRPVRRSEYAVACYTVVPAGKHGPPPPHERRSSRSGQRQKETATTAMRIMYFTV